MPRIQPVSLESASGDAANLLQTVNQAFGVVPNILGTFAQSPAVLEAHLAVNKALSKGLLDAQLREQIAMAMAGANACDYCASAHTAIGKGAGLAEDELVKNLAGEATDPKTQAALKFVRLVVARRGEVSDEDVAALRNAGFGDGEIVEIIMHIGVNTFTNYFNHIVDTDIDFPVVKTTEAARAA